MSFCCCCFWYWPYIITAHMSVANATKFYWYVVIEVAAKFLSTNCILVFVYDWVRFKRNSLYWNKNIEMMPVLLNISGNCMLAIIIRLIYFRLEDIVLFTIESQFPGFWYVNMKKSFLDIHHLLSSIWHTCFRHHYLYSTFLCYVLTPFPLHCLHLLSLKIINLLCHILSKVNANESTLDLKRVHYFVKYWYLESKT